jgi:protein-disulfide isomerase
MDTPPTSATLPIPVPVPRGSTPTGDGVMVGMGSVDLDCYIDFMCPSCKQFELMNGHILDRLLADLAIRLITHPMSVNDAASGTAYSTRAGAAAAAAADAGRFREYARTLFENQPPERGPALSDGELIELGLLVGISDRAFAETIRSGRYLPWPPYVTERATARGVGSTPSVFANGIPIAACPGPILTAVNAVLP